jgi:predicted kinase
MLLAIAGLPGTGKSTFAKALAQALKADHWNTDIIRDALNLRGQYDVPTKEKIYAEMLLRTAATLEQEKTAVVDATFYKASLRKKYEDLAKRLQLPICWIEIKAAEDVIRGRVQQKRQYSEADFEVYLKIKAQFEPIEQAHLVVWSDQMKIEEMVQLALQHTKKQYEYSANPPTHGAEGTS